MDLGPKDTSIGTLVTSKEKIKEIGIREKN